MNVEYIEGQDFALDSLDEGGDDFIWLPDSDLESSDGSVNNSSVAIEFVPETELHHEDEPDILAPLERWSFQIEICFHSIYQRTLM